MSIAACHVTGAACPVIALIEAWLEAWRRARHGVAVSILLLAAFATRATALPVNENADEAFESQVKIALAPLAGSAVAELKILYLSPDVAPWIDTGFQIRSGDRITWVLEGKSWRSRAHDRWLKPSQVVWARVGADGPILRGTRDTLTFTATVTGSLQLRHWNGLWQDEIGAFAGVSSPIDPDSGGVIRVALIRWSPGSNPEQELQHLAAQVDAPAWAAAELTRQKEVVAPLAPPGWRILGFAEMFRELRDSAKDAPQPRIELRTRNDIAVLQKDIIRDFTPETKLQWKWKLDKLPSDVPEDMIFAHDYISIAVKFDNGQDLTYFWSASLPVGKSFRCPFPMWATRETHLVVRSGGGELGKWLQESRNVFADYRRSVDGEPPKRITQIWLIGTSVMGRSEGLGQFGEIRIGDEKETADVY
ncbi:MAG TPA: DUF3047 domain-containing protein [Methylocystis sp.]|nr:DUF3047 domain-containing protein [Methylocystis sp.]